MQEVTTGMREMGFNNLEWVEKEGWRRKIKLKFQAQKDVKTLYIIIGWLCNPMREARVLIQSEYSSFNEKCLKYL